MGFRNSTVINYPVEEVFKVFIKVAKRDFPKFNEKDPVGCSVSKQIGAYSTKSASVRIEITDYKKDELYQITTVRDKMVYVSTYHFEKVDDDSTELLLEETEDTPGLFPGLNSMLQNLCYKGRIRKRFAFFVQGLENEIESFREKVEKHSTPKEDVIDEEVSASVELENEDIK
ncbi:MAG: DUF3284 domain-containing protein [Clostridium sp.]